MKTGEGKTLTATLAVVLNSLAVGEPDADGDAARDRIDAAAPGRARRHGQRLPRPSRRRMDEPDLRRAGRQRRRAREHAALRREAPRLRVRRRLRHELRVRLRLPAGQHGQGPLRKGPARASLRDRGRGRQHPHRRGAHAADHLGRARRGGRALQGIREARAAHDPRQDPGRHGPAHQEVVRRRLRLRDRREAQDGDRHRAGRDQGRALHEDRPSLPGGERPPRQPPDPGAASRVALQEGRRLRRDRRGGQDHRRVHGPHPRGAPLVGGPAPGRRGQGERRDPGGEPDARDDHLPELLPPLRQARRHDRYGADRGDRVHEDLRAAGRADPDQHADGARGPQRSGLQDQGGQVGGGRQGDRRAPPERAARARRHDLGRGLRAALRPPQAPGDRSPRAEREARARCQRGRRRRGGRPAGSGHDRDQHGWPRRRHQARRQPRAPRPPAARPRGPRAGRGRLRRPLRGDPARARSARSRSGAGR